MKKKHAKKKRLPKRPKKAPRKTRASKRKFPTARRVPKNTGRKPKKTSSRRRTRRLGNRPKRTSYAEHLNEYAGNYPNGRPKYKKLIENFEKRVVEHKPAIRVTEENAEYLYNKGLRFIKNKKSKTPIRKIEVYWVVRFKDDNQKIVITIAYAAPLDEHKEYFLERVRDQLMKYKARLYLMRETVKYSFATKTKRVRGGFRATQKKHKARKKAKNRNVRHRGK